MTLVRQSFIYSLLFHIFVIFLLLLIKFHSEPVITREYIEIITIEKIESPRAQTAGSGRPAQKETNKTAVSTQDAMAQQIDIPKVTVPDYEPVDISSLPQRSSRNVRSDAYKANVQDTLMRARISPQSVTESSPSLVANNVTPTSNVGLEGLAEEIRAQKGSFSQYKLDGDVINRTIVKKVLPDFPKEVMKNGTVTLHFSVVENGSVQNILITRKSEPEFEKVSIEALRQWIFNRSDRVHTGQITFNFKLE